MTQRGFFFSALHVKNKTIGEPFTDKSQSMSLKYALISVFIDSPTGALGNISAVIFSEDALPESTMQGIAADMNQPATTFIFAPGEEGVHPVRWFAPDSEIGLCGHGSAAACVYLAERQGSDTFSFRAGRNTISGKASAEDGSFEISLDALPVTREISVPEALTAGLGIKVRGHYATGNKNIVLAESAEDVRNMRPKFHVLRTLDHFGYAVTAESEDEQYDFVSRTLVPHVGQLEDHATGSSHAALVPFWADRLGKERLTARQLSPRGGFFRCRAHGGRVSLAGNSKVIATGSILL